MREPVFTGACTAIVTPFDQSGAIDYGCFGRLIDQQLDHGVDAICVCGTTGESATLSIREHIAAVAFCVKRVNHRVKVIAGAGSNDTSAALYLSQHAQDSGADALLLVTPYYNKASQTGLIQHYTYIADRVELPPAPACCSIMPKWGHTERTSIRFLPHFLSFRVVLCRGSAPMAKAKLG